MRVEITPEETRALDTVWHKLLLRAQKSNSALARGRIDGISTIEISILAIVAKKPDVILKEILGILGIPASTLTGALDRLEKRGLMRRVVSARDRRSYGLELTDEGREIQKEHLRYEAELWREILGAFSPEDRRELIRLLGILAEHVGGEEKGGKDGT